MQDRFTPAKLKVSGIEGAEDFVNLIESSFGNYRASGMRDYISRELRSAEPKALKQLYTEVMENHEKQSVPKYSEILKIARNKGLSLQGSSKVVGAWHCKTCGALYPISDFFSCVCTKRISGQLCGSKDFDSANITPDDGNFRWLREETTKQRKQEKEDMVKRRADHFAKMALKGMGEGKNAN